MNHYGVIMAGGGGTRFWPLSRQKTPKQLLNLSGKDLMVNEAVDRMATVIGKSNIFIVTADVQAPSMIAATQGKVFPRNILAEPAARNTAACIGYAAMEILRKYNRCTFERFAYKKEYVSLLKREIVHIQGHINLKECSTKLRLVSWFFNNTPQVVSGIVYWIYRPFWMMLGFMRSDYETGLYQLASKGKSVLTLLGGIVWSSILPLASRLWREGERKQFESLAVKSVTIVCGIQLLVMTGALIFSREIMLFIGGEEYLESVDSFRILLLSLVPIGASNILGGQVLIPAVMEKKLLRAELLGAGFNFIANLIAIPYFSILGAAVTTTVSEVIVWLVCLYYVKKDLNMDFGVGLLRRLGRKCSRKVRVFSARATSRLRGGNLPFYCPCCDTYLKHFIDGGFDKKPERYNPDRYRGIDQNAICPVCGSLPRHRILVSWMNDHVEIIREKRILHFAQERSMRMWMDRNGIKSITADLYSPADLKLNIEDTGLEGNSYDLIICNHVLEHVSDYMKALRELHRIIRPAGKVIISFPVDQNLSSVYEDPSITTEKDRIKCFGQNDHLRVFGIDSPKMLESVGFKVTLIRGEDYDEMIKPVVGPADYDYNILWVLEK